MITLEIEKNALPMARENPAPIASSGGRTDTAIAVPREGRPDRSRRETILVVDDEEGILAFVTEVLESRGYDVLSAHSGAAALRKCSEREVPVDLLLTDVIMPGGMSGAELAERLQTRQPGLKVIYTSGYTPGMGHKELAVLNRPNFMPKPYGMERLLETVRTSLDQTG
jgi:two-component system cell cycle sensor histidine kinase/response regulator CckA